MLLPGIIFCCNSDISFPSPPYYIGSNPASVQSYVGPDILSNLQRQLFIDDTITKEEFDARVAADPNYPLIIHLQRLRVLVIFTSFTNGYKYPADDCCDGYYSFKPPIAIIPPKNNSCCDEIAIDNEWCDGYLPDPCCDPCAPCPEVDGYNFELYDVVMFLHQGLAQIKSNRFGNCPIKEFDIQRLTIYQLLNTARSFERGVCQVPGYCFPDGRCNDCGYGWWCDTDHTYSGIKICNDCRCGCDAGLAGRLTDNMGRPLNKIFLPNCDNERNNCAFKNRV